MSRTKTTTPKPAASNGETEAPDLEAAKAILEAAGMRVRGPKQEKKVWQPLADDHLEFVLANARPAEAPCICGCGATTKSRFAPGHDARLKERLKATDSAEAREAEARLGW